MLTIMFGDLKSDFTFSPCSPISPCWERKQSIKGRKAQEELGSVGESLQPLRVRLYLGLNSCQIMESLVYYGCFLPRQTLEYQLIKAFFKTCTVMTERCQHKQARFIFIMIFHNFKYTTCTTITFIYRHDIFCKGMFLIM